MTVPATNCLLVLMISVALTSGYEAYYRSRASARPSLPPSPGLSRQSPQQAAVTRYPRALSLALNFLRRLQLRARLVPNLPPQSAPSFPNLPPQSAPSFPNLPPQSAPSFLSLPPQSAVYSREITVPSPFTLTPQISSSQMPGNSYLNPANFHLPPMSLQEMQFALEEIERHTRSKDGNNTADYTGSRLLILLLREECARLSSFGDETASVFCSQFESRFRSLFF